MSSKLLEHISKIDAQTIALESGEISLTFQQLLNNVEETTSWLLDQDAQSVALYAQNSIDWVIVDLACQSLGILLTPIPLFFSTEQFNQVIESVKPDLILSDEKVPLAIMPVRTSLDLKGYRLANRSVINVPTGTTKVTYTSGSTGSPKGVCLSEDNQWKVAQSLVDVIGIEKPKHLCLLPLPTLLENIAGLYAPLIAKGTIIIASDKARGFCGSQLVAPEQLIQCISDNQPNTLILVPELLHVLIGFCSKGWQPPKSLMFVAVGGSKVSQTMIVQARALGIPVCQGYGLSECASVVSLSTLQHDPIHCGKILPHLTVETVNGEIVVTGNTFLGYLEQPDSWGNKAVRTGDIGTVVNDCLTIDGRTKNTLINSLGRNISPEWVESELMATGSFMQAVVIGDAKPFCSALLVPISSEMSFAEIHAVVHKVNSSLPDYAQIKAPILLTSPMTIEQGLYTQNMRPKRDAIHQYFKSSIAQVYADR